MSTIEILLMDNGFGTDRFIWPNNSKAHHQQMRIFFVS